MDIACRIEQSLYNLYPFIMRYNLKSDYSTKLRDLLFNLSDPHNPDLRQRLFSGMESVLSLMERCCGARASSTVVGR